MIVSQKTKTAIIRNKPEMLGILESYEEQIFNALDKKFYGLEKNIGMSKKRILIAIGKAAYYYRQFNYSRAKEKAKNLRDMIAKDMGATVAERAGILRLLLMLDAIQKPEFPLLATYLSPQKITASTVKDAAAAAVSQSSSAVADHLKQVAKETVSDAGKLVSSAYDTVNEIAPWYLKPKVLLPIGLIGLILFYGMPLLKAAKATRPKYLANPIPANRVKARKKYREFHATEPKKTVSVSKIDTSELVELGKALEIGYKSKKWEGKNNNYLHKFGRGVRLCSTADGKALIILGGKLETTERGIVG